MSRRIPAAVFGALALGLAVGAHAVGALPALPVVVGVELEPEDPSPGGQFVWVLNRSGKAIDLGCWAVRSRATGLTLWIVRPLRVPAGGVATLTPPVAWLKAVDRVQLLDRGRHVVDQTPTLRDTAYDDRIWHRSPAGEWRFGRTKAPGKEVIAGRLTQRTPSRC